MELGLWQRWYRDILDDFGFSQEDDEYCAKQLDEILFKQKPLTLDDLYAKVTNNRKIDKCIVFGAGPSLKNNIIQLKNDYELDDYVLIAADGATTALIEEHIVPDIIVTDLDGNLDDILLANTRDAAVVIHAHGNNLESIIDYTHYFDNVLGTTQSKPHGNLYNFGGFTDGDRAIFLAVALGAREILLAGMDFGDIVTQYSRPNNENFLQKADEIKEKKLQYAEKLTDWVINNENVEISFL